MIAELPEDDVWLIVRTRSCMHDSAGTFARRVLDASRRRQVMNECADVYNVLGEGGSLAQAVVVLERLLVGIGIRAPGSQPESVGRSGVTP